MRKYARVAIALFGVAFAVFVALQFKRRTPAPSSAAMLRTDPGAVVETTAGNTLRITRKREDVDVAYQTLSPTDIEALRNELQCLVARGVTERVVDLLEMVDNDEEHSDAGALASCEGDGTADAIQRLRAIGRVRECIALARTSQRLQFACGVFCDGLRMQCGEYQPLVGLDEVDLTRISGIMRGGRWRYHCRRIPRTGGWTPPGSAKGSLRPRGSSLTVRAARKVVGSCA